MAYALMVFLMAAACRYGRETTQLDRATIEGLWLSLVPVTLIILPICILGIICG
jgi:hypothetical protein